MEPIQRRGLEAVAVPQTLRDVVNDVGAKQLEGAPQDHSGCDAIHVVIAVQEDRVAVTHRSGPPLDGGGHIGEQQRIVQLVERRPQVQLRGIGPVEAAHAEQSAHARWQLQLGGERLEFRAVRPRRREEELVVVAAGEHAVALELGTLQSPEHRGSRDTLILHGSGDAGALGDVREVAGEAVGDVDGGMREATQALAKLDARLRSMQPLRRLGDLRMHEAERGAAEFARYPDVVAGASAGALEGKPGRHFADRGDAQRAAFAARRVPADQIHAVALGERVEAVGKPLEPARVDRRQRE